MAVDAQTALFAFDNSYARLPPRFYARLAPTPVRAPRLLKLNVALARELGLDPERLAGPHGVAVLAGNATPAGAAPLAMAYAGHQFGGWVPQLGDGRAILLGEVIDRQGRRRDIQLKGSGPTPFSRNGDGRAALGPVLREYLVSEAMAALGAPTTRALAAVATGETVFRETPLPGAIVVRVAASHIRVGTFQFFAARDDVEALRLLAEHALARHFPDAAGASPAHALLDAAVGAQAALVARWMHLGFIHGVMNTDNMAVSGETIDYGPCAFMDAYDPAQVYSYIDRTGRYAYANQPRIAHWNLACLAQALLPLLGETQAQAVAAAQAVVDGFPDRFAAAHLAGMRAKLGLARAEEGDAALGAALLDAMAAGRADFTLSFRALSALSAAAAGPADAALRALFADPAPLDAWLPRWRDRLGREARDDGDRQAAMRAANPAFIPRNHRVEAALAAAQAGDMGPFERLHAVLARPWDDQPEAADLSRPPQPAEVVENTFCGT